MVVQYLLNFGILSTFGDAICKSENRGIHHSKSEVMEFLENLLPSQSQLRLDSYELDLANQQLTLSVSSTQVIACCPICHCSTHRIHSHYERTLKDLPCVNFCLTIFLQVCKFFCTNQACQRRIFTERLPDVAVPWSRKTVRFAKHLSEIGIALGGAAAARLCNKIHYGGSRNTLLRGVSTIPLSSSSTPKILGVDDFAFRRGKKYGTILVDLEKHQPIDLLADREAKTLEHWLKEHPGVEIVSRDRSKAYRAGAREGAPNALQVADRFHLLQNLEEALENVFSSHSQAIKTVELTLLKAKLAEHQAADTIPSSVVEPLIDPNSRKAQNRARRLAKYEQVHALRQQGYLIKDIAHHLGMGKRTVYTYLAAPTFPEYKTSQRRGWSGLNSYKPYLLGQWKQGRHNAKQLFTELQQQGFKGSYSMVVRYTHKLRESLPPQPTRESLNELPGRGPAPDEAKVGNPNPLTVRSAAWLVMRKVENLTEEDEEALELLSGQPKLSRAIDLAQSFLLIVRKRLPQHLDLWLERAQNSALKSFQSFAKGIRDDYEAVKASLILEVSNGQVEGQNNRLKMLKRQMFGRAGLELLTKRLILSSSEP